MAGDIYHAQRRACSSQSWGAALEQKSSSQAIDFPIIRLTMEPLNFRTKCKHLSFSSVVTCCDSYLCLAACFLFFIQAVLHGRITTFPLYYQSSSAPWFQFKWFSFPCHRDTALCSFYTGEICITHKHLQSKFLIKHIFQLMFLIPDHKNVKSFIFWTCVE